MALMHCCCFCCTPKSGSIAIGTLQLLSLIIGAGLLGVLLTGVKYVQDADRIRDILQDLFEVDLDAIPGGLVDGQVEVVQAALQERTEIVEQILYGILGYIGLDFILTCVMIHGARTNNAKLLFPWVFTNGLRASASLAAGIYMMIKRSSWANELADELNDILDVDVTLPPTPSGSGGRAPASRGAADGLTDAHYVDPELLEVSLTSMAGILIGGSVLSLYFVLVVYSQFQIIRSNRSQTKRVQQRLSIGTAVSMTQSPSFTFSNGNAGAPNKPTGPATDGGGQRHGDMGMTLLSGGQYAVDDGDEWRRRGDGGFLPNAPPPPAGQQRQQQRPGAGTPFTYAADNHGYQYSGNNNNNMGAHYYPDDGYGDGRQPGRQQQQGILLYPDLIHNTSYLAGGGANRNVAAGGRQNGFHPHQQQQQQQQQQHMLRNGGTPAGLFGNVNKPGIRPTHQQPPSSMMMGGSKQGNYFSEPFPDYD